MLAVVYEAMTDTGPRRKGGQVPGPHGVKEAVDPGVNLTLENVHELFFFLLGMRPGTALPRGQAHQVHTNFLQSRKFADAPSRTGDFVAVRISVARLRTRGGGDDEGRVFGGLHPAHVTPESECRQLLGCSLSAEFLALR